MANEPKIKILFIFRKKKISKENMSMGMLG